MPDASKQAANCSCRFHIPAEVRDRGTTCKRYNAWLAAQARSCRTRDKGHLNPLPPIAAYLAKIHEAVVRSKGLDAYTGEKLEWNRLNHERPKTGGRRQHLKRQSYPSVDHYQGVGRLNYRICSGVTNLAKGAMDHQRFVALCRKVAAHHEGWGPGAADALPNAEEPVAKVRVVS